MQKFETERQNLKQINDSRIDALEQTIEEHRIEQRKEIIQTLMEQEETIKSLREHITQLEQINFQNEVSAVNFTNLSQSNLNLNQSKEFN
jgi:hypothetical protein